VNPGAYEGYAVPASYKTSINHRVPFNMSIKACLQAYLNTIYGFVYV